MANAYPLVTSGPAYQGDLIRATRHRTVALKSLYSGDWNSSSGDVSDAWNDYLATYGERSVELHGGEIPLTDSVVYPVTCGSAIYCGGMTEIRGNSEYSAPSSGSNVGGPEASRLVWHGAVNGTQCMLSTQGFGLTIVGCLNLQGYSASTRAAIIAANHNLYAPIGLLVKENPSGRIGTAKIAGNLSILACQTAIQLGEASDDDNADGLALPFLYVNSCTAGIYALTPQSVNHWIGSYHQVATPVGVKGLFGSAQFGQVTMNGSACVAFWRPGSLNLNANSIDVGLMDVDGSCPSALVLDMTDGAGTPVHSKANLTIGNLQLKTSATGPKFIVSGGGQVTILGGSNFYNGMFECHNVTSGIAFAPKIVICGGQLQSGQDGSALIANTSTGYCSIEYGLTAYNGSNVTRTYEVWNNGSRVESHPYFT